MLKIYHPVSQASSRITSCQTAAHKDWLNEVNKLLIENNPHLAFQTAMKSALAGIVDAQRFVGNMYSNGEGTSVNNNEAMQWYLKAAESGDQKAMHNIGTMYFQGLGVEQDYNLASQWFRKAAIKGSDIDQYNLGLMYASGIGLEKNSGAAEYWLNKAASQNNSDAKKALIQIQREKDKSN